jgi:hypothetical protein
MRCTSCSCLHGSGEATQRPRRIGRAMHLCRKGGHAKMTSWVWSPREHLVVDRVELCNGVCVVGEDISTLFDGSGNRWIGRGVEAGLHHRQRSDKRHRIDARVDVRRGRDRCVTEDLLRNLKVAGQIENALCKRVPEEMWMNGTLPCPRCSAVTTRTPHRSMACRVPSAKQPRGLRSLLQCDVLP